MSVTIDCISELHPRNFYHFYYRRQRPVLLSGAAQAWLPCQKWTPDYLVARLGEKAVKVFRNDTRLFGLPGTQSHTLPFAAAAQLILAEAPYRVRGSPIRECYPELWPDLEPLPLLSPWQARMEMLLWFSPGDCVTPLHYDPWHTCFVQVYGKKRFTLFAPADAPWLYPDEAAAHSGQKRASRVDITQPDEEQFPLFRRATAIRVELGAGDMLYIPPGWWHAVKSLDVEISLTNYWEPS